MSNFQDFICEKGIQFVRIDGATIPRDRKIAVETFRLTKEVICWPYYCHLIVNCLGILFLSLK